MYLAIHGLASLRKQALYGTVWMEDFTQAEDDEMNEEQIGTTHKEKLALLFKEQKQTLDCFLERGAITKAQHDKSLHDLKEKMGVEDCR